MCRSSDFVRYRTDESLRRLHSGGDGLFRFRGAVLRSGGASRAAKYGVHGKYDETRDSTTHQTCKWQHDEASADSGKAWTSSREAWTEFCEAGAEPIKTRTGAETGARSIQTVRPERR
jgi:hypothetical protein